MLVSIPRENAHKKMWIVKQHFSIKSNMNVCVWDFWYTVNVKRPGTHAESDANAFINITWKRESFAFRSFDIFSMYFSWPKVHIFIFCPEKTRLLINAFYAILALDWNNEVSGVLLFIQFVDSHCFFFFVKFKWNPFLVESHKILSQISTFKRIHLIYFIYDCW